VPDVSDISTDDESLARRAREGCRASFEALVRRHQVPLLHFLMRQLGGRADAEDVLQETFVRAYVSLHRFNPRWRFKTWLFTIGRNLAVSHRRRNRSSSATTDLTDIGQADDPTMRLARQEEHDSLWEMARATLSEEQVAALWLYYVEDLSAGQVARVLDRSWVSTKTMMHRARKRLMTAMTMETQDGSRENVVGHAKRPAGRTAEARG
jgi:RNA polymerase sigma-70 factor (ECF subfamily)